MTLHDNNLTAAQALDHLAAIVERDELTPTEAAYCIRANWQWERELNHCEMPAEVLVVVNELEGMDLDPVGLASLLRQKARGIEARGGPGEV